MSSSDPIVNNTTSPTASASNLQEIHEQLILIGKKARAASRAMAKATPQQKNLALLQMGMAIRLQTSLLKEANLKVEVLASPLFE